MLMDYPRFNGDLHDPQAESDMGWVQAFILSVRNIRGEMNIAPKLGLKVLIKQGTAADEERYAGLRALIHKLANIAEVIFVAADHPIPMSATAVVGHLELFVPLAGLIDKDAELARLNKQIAKLSDEHTKLSSKLDNASYVSRAPADVVARDKARVAELASTMAKLKLQVQHLEQAFT